MQKDSSPTREAPVITASRQFTEESVIEAMKRARQISSSRFTGYIVKGVAIAFLAPLTVVIGYFCLDVSFRSMKSLQRQLPSISMLMTFVAGMVVLWNVQHIQFWLTRRQFRKSPFFNEMLFYEFSDSGFRVRCSKSDSMLAWAIFSKVVRFGDGLLVFQGQRLFYWIPVYSLTDIADEDRLADLMRTKIPVYVDKRM